MRNYALCALMLVAILSGCFSDKNYRYFPDSVGKPYEVFVVAEVDDFQGAAGDSLAITMEDEVSMISTPEPSFKLFNILPRGFSELNRKHRNIIIFNVGSQYTTPKVKSSKDVYSKPQMITVFEAPDYATLVELVTKSRHKIKESIESEELHRFAEKSAKIADKEIKSVIDTMFNINLSLPHGYKIRNKIGSDFLWASFELPETSQGVVIYEYPYNGDSLTVEQIIAQRNEFVKQIPGEMPNSYMTTSDMLDPKVSTKEISGTTWYETRGFWRVANDFLAGSFASYSAIDKERNRVIVLDWYVFSPSPYKGEAIYLRQLMGIMETTKINK